MDRREVVEGIGASWRFLSDCTLAESFASADPIGVDTEFRDLIFRGDCTHEEIHSYCLSRSHFNILLFDHSFFQYSWTSSEHVRFAYYPNPYVSDLTALNKFRRYREMLSEGSIADEDFDQLVSGMAYRGNVPIFRYENAPSQHVPLRHPCSHLHIGLHGENRWAVRRMLTPLAFTMLLVKHYYPEEWALGVRDGSLDGANGFEHLLADERRRCRAVSAFTDEEERAFHLI